MTTRLLLVDDHIVVRLGLKMLLENEPDFIIVGEADSASKAISDLQTLQPDVILMDIGLPDMSGIDATYEIKRIRPSTAVIALTIHEDEEYFFKMLEAGASGYVPKRAAPEELVSAIRTVASGDVYLFPSLAKLLVNDFLRQDRTEIENTKLDNLTDREQEVLTHLAEGASNNEIGEILSISPKTVSRHRENIMNKLDLHNRSDLVKYAIRKGIIEP